MGSSSALLFIFLSLLIHSRATQELKGTDIKLVYPAVELNPSPHPGQFEDFFLCDRVKVYGISRLKLGKFFSAFRITVVPSVVIPERLHSKVLVCFHRNNSPGLCHCEKDEWRAIQKGLWSSVMSPYEDKYVDVKFIDPVKGSVSVALDEDSQQWRLFFLALGFVLLFLAPIVSWVPFYYISSMNIRVVLLILIILFQLGAGSFLLHHFSVWVNSILVYFGMPEEMYDLVQNSLLLLFAIFLRVAAASFSFVKKFIISEDESVDVGVARFVKWAMRIIGTMTILQCTLDTPLALGAAVACWTLCSLINSLKSGGVRAWCCGV